MAYRVDQTDAGDYLVIDGWENGISPSPYKGIANMRNVNCSYYPGVAYVNYRRQAASLANSTVGFDNSGYLGSTTFPADGLNYTLSGNYTCTGTNRTLLVQSTNPNSSVTGITYNSVSLTKITDALDSNSLGQTLYDLVAPSTGSNSVVVTASKLNQTGNIATDAFNHATQAAANNQTLSHTSTGTNLALIAYVMTNNTSDVVTGVTAIKGGIATAMTLVQKGQVGGSGNFMYMFSMIGQDTGAHNVVAAASAANIVGMMIGSYTGVQQIVSTDVSGKQTVNTVNTISLGLTTTVPNDWTIYTVSSTQYPSTSVTNMTLEDSSGAGDFFYDSHAAIASPGLYTAAWNNTNNTFNAVMFGVALKPVSSTYTLSANAVSYTGVRQTGQPDASTSKTTIPQSSQSLTLTTVANNCTTVMAIYANPNTTVTPTGSLTMRQDNTASSNELWIGDSNGSVGNAGSTSLTANFSGSVADTTAIMISLAPLSVSMGNPVQHATSPAGLNYILDSNGYVWKQNSINSSSFSTIGNGYRSKTGSSGIAYWNNYIAVFGAGVVEFCGDGTGDSTIDSNHWNVTNSQTLVATVFSTNFAVNANHLNPSLTLATFPYIQIGTPVTFSTTGTLPAPLATGTTYYIIDVDTGNNIYEVSTTLGGSTITLTSDGTGTHTMNSSVAISLPIGNVTTISMTWIAQSTTATITSYTNPNGSSAPSGIWQLPTGIYNIIDTNGNNLLASFVYGSNSVTFQTLTTFGGTASSVQLFFSNTVCKPYVSKVDGNLYFTNGMSMGSFLIAESNTPFFPANSQGFTLNYSTFELGTGANSGSDSIVDMTDLNTSMIVAGKNKIYTWDYTSAFTNAPIPVEGNISKVINLLNLAYVFAGPKGNIYTSNGSYAQLLTKIPDNIAGNGIIDPVWSFGSVMTHRSKLFFQAFAQDTSGNNLIAGIFSVIVSPSILGEQASGVVMEAQNSYGTLPSSGATSSGILIDNQAFSAGADSYYSAYSTGSTSGGIDFNDATPWQNNESVIETDIVPLGSILNKKTLGEIEFLTDRPMSSSDSISLFYRSTLTGSYTSIGTTTGTGGGIIANYLKSNIWESIWVQFKITMSGSSSSSSFIPLREIRIQMQ